MSNASCTIQFPFCADTTLTHASSLIDGSSLVVRLQFYPLEGQVDHLGNGIS